MPAADRRALARDVQTRVPETASDRGEPRRAWNASADSLTAMAALLLEGGSSGSFRNAASTGGRLARAARSARPASPEPETPSYDHTRVRRHVLARACARVSLHPGTSFTSGTSCLRSTQDHSVVVEVVAVLLCDVDMLLVQVYGFVCCIEHGTI